MCWLSMYRRMCQEDRLSTLDLEREVQLYAVSQSIPQDRSPPRLTFRPDEGALKIPQICRREGIDYRLDPWQVKERCWPHGIFFEEPFFDSRH